VIDDRRGYSYRDQPARLWNLAWDQVLELDGAVWKSVVVALVAVTGLWLVNISGFAAWNVAFTVLGYIGIWWFGLRPTHIALSGATGGLFATLFDRDLSRTWARGPAILYQVVRQVAYIFLLIGFASFTWDFSRSPLAFWLVLIGVTILIQTGDALGKWKNRIIVGYVLVSIGAALFSTLGVYSGRAFDPDTGGALYMVDPTTGRVDSERRTPADCAAKPCYSAETGQKLVPMQKEQALERNPAGIVSSITNALSGSKLSDLLSSQCPQDGAVVPMVGELHLTVGEGACEEFSVNAKYVNNMNLGLDMRVDQDLPGRDSYPALCFISFVRWSRSGEEPIAHFKLNPEGFQRHGIAKVNLGFFVGRGASRRLEDPGTC